MTSTPTSTPDATASAGAPHSGARARRRRRRLAAVATFLVGLGLFAAYLASDVDTELTAQDREAIASLGQDAVCQHHLGFDAELACVRALQAAMREAAADYTCVHEYGQTSHEPADFLERGVGCCYDRSRLIEKALTHYGFEVRHLGIWRGDSVATLAQRGVSSHSLSEVRTQRGWMVVDSNWGMVGIGRRGQVFDARQLRQHLNDGREDLIEADYSNMLQGDYVIVYGLYSRHGGFYAPYLPIPGVDWAQLHHNVW